MFFLGINMYSEEYIKCIKEEKSKKLILSNKEILTLEEYIIKYIVPNLNEKSKNNNRKNSK